MVEPLAPSLRLTTFAIAATLWLIEKHRCARGALSFELQRSFTDLRLYTPGLSVSIFSPALGFRPHSRTHFCLRWIIEPRQLFRIFWQPFCRPLTPYPSLLLRRASFLHLSSLSLCQISA